MNGDSITVLRDRTQIRIRLDGIDCPDGGQAFDDRAKQFTSTFVFRRTVESLPTDVDRYGRTVARVRVDGRDLSLELVSGTALWVRATVLPPGHGGLAGT